MAGVRLYRAALLAGLAISSPQVQARDASVNKEISELRREIAALRQQVQALAAARAERTTPTLVPAAAADQPDTGVAMASQAATPPAPSPALASATSATSGASPAHGKAWYEKLTLRGYTQLRVNEILAGDATAPAGVSRLRSVQDSGLTDKGNFSIRRARLVIQGDLSSRVSLYLQGDLASSVSNQTSGERREGYFQMRDAYADIFLDRQRRFKLRLGQSKVPVGWENMQSSSNRLALDRSDAINSAVPGERDLGIVGYYTPARVQRIWDHLAKDGHKLFGNYGAFAIGVFNGQGVNRAETNNGLMKVAFATWPVALGGALHGQVFEFGGALMQNKIQPEMRSGGVSTAAFHEKRVSLHAMLYPNPFGLQAEWTWGQAPVWNRSLGGLTQQALNGGYVQASFRAAHTPMGAIIPFARWQYYDGSWKAAVNAPPLQTRETELGVEWQPLKEVEFTLSYADTQRVEADERRTGLARGQTLRGQVQWNY